MVIDALKMLPAKSIFLIVAQARALFTLAEANALDTLFQSNRKVIIPDMVKYEIAQQTDQPGARKIQNWIENHADQMVSIGHTEEYEYFNILYRLNQSTKLRNRGERSALEILLDLIQAGVDVVFIVFEDTNVKRSNIFPRLPDNVFLTTSTDLLSGLKHQKD